jgi:hypothetical protein
MPNSFVLHTDSAPDTENLVNISRMEVLKQAIAHSEEKRWHKNLQIYEADHTISLINVQLPTQIL